MDLMLGGFSSSLCAMTVEFQYTESDYVASQIAWVLLHPFMLIRSFWYPIAVLVLVAIAVFNHPEHWQNAAMALLVAIGLIVFSTLITRWKWNQRFMKTPWMQSPVSVTVDGQGIKLRGQGFEDRNFWGVISEIRETSKIFMFIQPNNAFNFIPKRAMTLVQVGETRSVITANAMGKVKLASNLP